MNDIILPTLLFWENGNTFYGSSGQARFFIYPQKKEAVPESPPMPPQVTLELELWRGPRTKARSEILCTASFPLSEEGLVECCQWLAKQAEQLET